MTKRSRTLRKLIEALVICAWLWVVAAAVVSIVRRDYPHGDSFTEDILFQTPSRAEQQRRYLEWLAKETRRVHAEIEADRILEGVR